MADVIVTQDFVSVKCITDIINLERYSNVFNPGTLIAKNILYVTFRAFDRGFSKFHSFLIKYDLQKQLIEEEIDISEICNSYNIDICADPKLLQLDNEVWLTFNTGYSLSPNSIYLMRVCESPGKPYQCLLEGRKTIEKNWAFFKSGDELQAIYSLTPFLKIFLYDKCEERNIFFFKFINDQSLPVLFSKKRINLSIGTQLVKVGDTLHLIAHEKIKIGYKRLYFGHFVTVKNSNAVVHPKRLFHSYKSLLGSKIKHNKNLISCTYFSGLMLYDKYFIVSYGINDITFDIKKIPQELIWN
jgi:hypothetical protein